MPHDPLLAERLRRIVLALDTMDPLPRRVFELHCMHGVDYAGIAAAGRSCTFCALPVSLADPEAGCAR
jgi:hypothetical protein